MSIRFSVIIPTHNRAQQLLLTLASFEAQSFPKPQYEVIVVDDASTDGTQEMVIRFASSYTLKYVRHEENKGRSITRNRGLQHAAGEYVIFCDADFLVLPKFLDTMSRYTIDHPKAVFSGVPYSWNDVYTHYHPDFSPEEKELFRQVLTAAGGWKNEYETAEGVIPLLSPEELMHGDGQALLTRYLLPPDVPPDVQQQFCMTDVAPWIMFITRCVTVRRDDLNRAGGFNERFINHGLEDWDLGYRLHRLKIPYVVVAELLGYHQEHPNHVRGVSSNSDNLRIMFEQYGFRDPELNMLALYPAWMDVEVFKHTLRMIRPRSRFRSVRRASFLLRRTLHLAALQFYHRRKSPVFPRALRLIRRQVRVTKRNRETVIALRRMLNRSMELIE
ncbi:glycosyltransferase family 2 protein [Paenibacillus koleovorans]|uniref:glycosyltransferase family 2 protein n=1 Tax=Paenibacillus koleovorans TaxID=121608 RepID=UPI000FD78D55|nr:glycosyltransferase [Paenibacillus koleovorans]